MYVIQPNQKLSKLSPKGKIGLLLGYNEEIGLWKILTQKDKIMDTKHVQFLKSSSKKADGELSIDVKEDTQESEVDPKEVALKLDCEGDLDSGKINSDTISISSNDDDKEFAESLVPKMVSSQVLRDRNSKVKPVKYTYLTTNPALFKKAIKCKDSKLWQAAAEKEIASIEHHEVWKTHFNALPPFFKPRGYSGQSLQLLLHWNKRRLGSVSRASHKYLGWSIRIHKR